MAARTLKSWCGGTLELLTCLCFLSPLQLCKGKLKQQMFHNERTVPYHSTIQPCLLELAQWDGA